MQQSHEFHVHGLSARSNPMKGRVGCWPAGVSAAAVVARVSGLPAWRATCTQAGMVLCSELGPSLLACVVRKHIGLLCEALTLHDLVSELLGQASQLYTIITSSCK